jgi:hypothetical protein
MTIVITNTCIVIFVNLLENICGLEVALLSLRIDTVKTPFKTHSSTICAYLVPHTLINKWKFSHFIMVSLTGEKVRSQCFYLKFC